MNRAWIILVVPFLLGAATRPAVTPERFREVLAARAADLERENRPAVRGSDGFYFLTSELRSYGAGRFWGQWAAKAGRSDEDPDPLPAILEFHEQLQRADVSLILVPVPGKIVLYPEKLDPRLASTVRPDEPHREFYEILRKHGVDVLDLTDDLLALRTSGVDPFCRNDTHWSPQAVKLAAARIAEAVRRQPWQKGIAKRQAAFVEERISIRGDLASEQTPREELAITQVKLGGIPVVSDRDSPLLLIGDSSILVFHDGTLAEHAGLPDHLAAELGFVADVIGVRGSAPNAPRAALARRRDNLAGKKCVIWCLSAREFTESPQGWQRIPVVRDRPRP